MIIPSGNWCAYYIPLVFIAPWEGQNLLFLPISVSGFGLKAAFGEISMFLRVMIMIHHIVLKPYSNKPLANKIINSTAKTFSHTPLTCLPSSVYDYLKVT